MTESFQKQLLLETQLLGLQLTEEQCNMLYQYYEMLIEKNKVMNLTAITEEKDVITKHFTDSLALIKILEDTDVSRETFFKDKSLIDVGTGAGFPGLVLKIIFPELRVVLTDSLKKRLTFLDDVISCLHLKKIETLHGRAEDLGHQKQLREQFDYAVSRAVANMSTLAEYDLPFVKQNGLFTAYKSADMREELSDAENAIHILGGKIEKIVRYTLPDSDILRSLIVVKKTGNTPARYPRKAGTPQKDPIH